MKGIILAGGMGTRLYPATYVVNKQLLPVYDKPMVYYSVCTMIMAGIRDVLIITSPHDLPNFINLLGTGEQWGMGFAYKAQKEPNGIGEAFILGREFVGNDDVCLCLGDNIFYGHGFPDLVQEMRHKRYPARMFSYRVNDPQRYCVVTVDGYGTPTGLEEKPKVPKSNTVIPGVYFYDNSVLDVAAGTSPSARGELEITDINRHYLNRRELHIKDMGRGIAWLDTGTPSALLKAAQFVETVEERQGLKVCCPEEVAYQNGFIEKDDLLKLAHQWEKSDYGKYLLQVANP